MTQPAELIHMLKQLPAWDSSLQCAPGSGCQFHSLLPVRKLLVIFLTLWPGCCLTSYSALSCQLPTLSSENSFPLMCPGPSIPKVLWFLFQFIASLIFFCGVPCRSSWDGCVSKRTVKLPNQTPPWVERFIREQNEGGGEVWKKSKQILCQQG